MAATTPSGNLGRLIINSSDPRIIYHNRTEDTGKVQVWTQGLSWVGHGPTVTYASTTNDRGWAEFTFPEPAVGLEYWGLLHDFPGTYDILCPGTCQFNGINAQGQVGPPVLLYSTQFDTPQVMRVSLVNHDSPQMDIVSFVLILPSGVSAPHTSGTAVVTPPPALPPPTESVSIVTNTVTAVQIPSFSAIATSVPPTSSSLGTLPSAPSMTSAPTTSASSTPVLNSATPRPSNSKFLHALIIGAVISAVFVSSLGM
ncbi:hypothetical protein BJ165DRAFT_1596028 [Panaeolus papilionaceus]|nr:hypothetical protein BJ165DRAFT_1596028 [Panaeolus papilionaceus]